MQPKARLAAVKDEPLSPGVKSEPGRSPQKGTTAKPTRVKKADGEKKVVVKKEYSNPGQTRETPSEVNCSLMLRSLLLSHLHITTWSHIISLADSCAPDLALLVHLASQMREIAATRTRACHFYNQEMAPFVLA